MAFSKVSLVTLLFLVVTLTTIANARVELYGSSKGWEEFHCSDCTCTESNPPECSRFEWKIGGCPLACGEPCICTRSIPPQCQCTYKVDSCNPEMCPNLNAGMAELEKLLLRGSSRLN